MGSLILSNLAFRYFPKGAAHYIQGVEDENEYLLAFDEADFDKIGCVITAKLWVGCKNITNTVAGPPSTLSTG